MWTAVDKTVENVDNLGMTETGTQNSVAQGVKIHGKYNVLYGKRRV